jgi:small-conductance mechanosensitive channel
MTDLLKRVLMETPIAVVLGGILLWLMSMLTGQVANMVGLQTIVGGIIALVVLAYVAAASEFEKTTFFELVMLLVAMSVIGTIIAMVAGSLGFSIGTYLLAGSDFNLNGLAWALAAIGLSFIIVDKIEDEL